MSPSEQDQGKLTHMNTKCDSCVTAGVSTQTQAQQRLGIFPLYAYYDFYTCSEPTGSDKGDLEPVESCKYYYLLLASY